VIGVRDPGHTVCALELCVRSTSVCARPVCALDLCVRSTCVCARPVCLETVAETLASALDRNRGSRSGGPDLGWSNEAPIGGRSDRSATCSRERFPRTRCRFHRAVRSSIGTSVRGRSPRDRTISMLRKFDVEKKSFHEVPTPAPRWADASLGAGFRVRRRVCEFGFLSSSSDPHVPLGNSGQEFGRVGRGRNELARKDLGFHRSVNGCPSGLRVSDPCRLAVRTGRFVAERALRDREGGL
jgi:hypothetical protein